MAFNRIERVLLTMAGGVIGVSIIAILAVFIARSTGKDDFSDGIWPTVAVVPPVGLVIGALLVIVFLVVSVVRRRGAGGRG